VPLTPRLSLSPGVTKGKLRPWFYGSYRVAAIVNDVGYRLELPPRACMHDVFHVGLLKKFVGMPSAALKVLCLVLVISDNA
jgi:hypothetical protein